MMMMMMMMVTNDEDDATAELQAVAEEVTVVHGCFDVNGPSLQWFFSTSPAAMVGNNKVVDTAKLLFRLPYINASPGSPPEWIPETLLQLGGFHAWFRG
jgi:hypothetical protein